MCGWAQVLEDEDLSDPTSNTAKQFRTDFRLPYPFFSELVNLLKVTPLHQTRPAKITKNHSFCAFSGGVHTQDS